MQNGTPAPNVDAALRGLKDFQLATVEYVFRRLYLGPDPTRRFLIADEVGLGKTLVARGVIARTIDHLWDKVKRIDVVYICSNTDIARQNINRLNVTGREDFALASRITLLPTQLSDLKHNRLNFVSFTPGTSFDLKSSLGTAEERALICTLVRRAWKVQGTGPLNVLQGRMGVRRFRYLVAKSEQDEIDESIAEMFSEALRQKEELRSRFMDLCGRFSRARKYIPGDDADDRAKFVGEIRTLLAAICLEALQPDLIILDEFQRFKHLLEGKDEAGRLAQELFDYSDHESSARVILLSATPYKMYTLNDEAVDDDHYQDFLRTLRFLQPDAGGFRHFEQLLGDYRHELLRLGSGNNERLLGIKRELEGQLRQVMVRTERLAVSEDRNGMLVEAPTGKARLEAQDLNAYLATENVARTLEYGGIMEYWKSAPYLLNFMEDYELKRTFREGIADTQVRSELAEALAGQSGLLLSSQDISAYEKVDPANARLRSLIEATVGLGAWRLVWIPPSFPYYELEGPFASPDLANFTKRLVFSSWRVVPKVIATLLSYEAERQMIRSLEQNPVNTPEARKRRGPRLRFARDKGQLTGMPVLGLIYPSVTLARNFDPLAFLVENGQDGRLPRIDELVGLFELRIGELLDRVKVGQSESGLEDKSWYWAAPILFDLAECNEATRDWFGRSELAAIWSGESPTEDEEGAVTAWAAHVDEARRLVTGDLKLGRRPSDLSTVLAQLAIAGPGVAALRALSRVAGGVGMLPADAVRDSAAQVAHASLTLFNLPEVMALLRGMNNQEPYWRRVLEYCVNGGLQPTLDEYAHVVRECLGLISRPPEETATKIGQTICSALTLRTSRLGVDKIDADPSSGTVALDSSGISMRGRFALRFGEERSDDNKEVRAEQVRTAFNSPFWPFVLATTSVGQEGLDFHLYCHAVVHWNLPSNPVDLEQREGRIHRYKGHAIRKNVAKRYVAALVDSILPDPWNAVFEIATREREPDASDLVPFWLYPLAGGAKIERHVPSLPLSREIDRLSALRRSLAVYRMVFGQNRQEDLLEYLLNHLSRQEAERIAEDMRINLAPDACATTTAQQLTRPRCSNDDR
jgi:hypothetical protein